MEYDVTDEIKSKIASNFAICKYGYFLYAYQYEDMRFICAITRQKDYETLVKNLSELHPNGKIVYKYKCTYPLTERNLTFMLKQNSISLGQNNMKLLQKV